LLIYNNFPACLTTTKLTDAEDLEN